MSPRLSWGPELPVGGQVSLLDHAVYHYWSQIMIKSSLF